MDAVNTETHQQLVKISTSSTFTLSQQPTTVRFNANYQKRLAGLLQYRKLTLTSQYSDTAV